MARKRKDELSALDDILGTGAKRKPAQDTQRVKAVGVTLDRATRDAFQEIAAAHGVSRNALMRHALAAWLALYRAGEIELQFETERRLTTKP